MTTQNKQQFVSSSSPIQPSTDMRFPGDRFGKKRKGDVGGSRIGADGGGHNGTAGISSAAKAAASKRKAATRTATRHTKLTTAIPNTKFDSVMDRPFSPWNDMEEVIAKFVPTWTHRQRGCILRHTIRFLELKVVMDELVSSTVSFGGNCLAGTSSGNPIVQTSHVLYSRLSWPETKNNSSFHG
jgi:hypothetical protein